MRKLAIAAWVSGVPDVRLGMDGVSVLVALDVGELANLHEYPASDGGFMDGGVKEIDDVGMSYLRCELTIGHKC